MGLKCKISFNDKGVASVTDSSGNPSELYNNVLEMTGNQEDALNMWSAAYSDELDREGEDIDINKLVKYMDQNASNEQELSPSEKFQVKDFMARNNIESLDSLYSTLSAIFKPDGVFDLDVKKALDSGLYTEEELRELDADKLDDLLVKMRGHLQKEDFKVSPTTEDTFYKNSDRKTAFGTFEKVTREDVDQAILDVVEDFKDEEEFFTKISNLPFPEFIERFEQDAEFSKNVINKFKGLKKIETLHIEGNTLTDKNRKTATTVRNTLLSNVDTTSIEVDIETIEQIDSEVWNNNPDLVKSLLKEVEATMVEAGVDVIGISDRVSSQQEILQLLDSAKNMLETESIESIERFSELHDSLIPPQETKLFERLPDKYTGYTIVNVNSNLSQNELFNKFGLIKVADNLYHNVDNEVSVDVVKDFIYKGVLDGEISLPSEYKLEDPQNKVQSLETISNYLMSRDTKGIFDNKELYSAYQVAFDHNPLKDKTKEAVKITDIRTDEIYLKSEFSTDFYNYILKEKLENTDLYNKVLSKFEVNDADITLVGEVNSIEDIELRDELYDYIRIKKDSSMNHLLPPTDGVLTESLLYTNFPELKTEFEGDIVVDRNYVLTNPTSDEFIKLNGVMYRKVMERPSSNLFKALPPLRDSLYYSTASDIQSLKPSESELKEAEQVMDKYGALSPSSVDHTEFSNIVAKSRINDNMRDDLRELSTLTDKSYTFFEVNNSIVAYKDGQRVGSIRPENIVEGTYKGLNVSVSESHRGKGIGTELYLRLFDKMVKKNLSLIPSDVRTKQAQSIYSRMEGLLEKQPDGSFKVKSDENIPTKPTFQVTDSSNDLESIKREAIADGTFMKAPNGNPTNLSEKQWLQVRTSAFKNWFGDWQNNPENSSKVVDENGEPLVVYHGSPALNIEVFDRKESKRVSSGLKELGTYFSSNKNLAKLYSKEQPKGDYKLELDRKITRLKELQNNVRNNREFDEIQSEIDMLSQKGRVYPVFLNLRDIHTFDGNAEVNIEAWRNLEVDAGYKIATGRDAMEFLSPEYNNENAIEERFGVKPVDGVKAENIIEMSIGKMSRPEVYKQTKEYKEAKEKYLGDAYLVFDGQPQNIKSADENTGAFSPTDARINFQQEGLGRLRAQPRHAFDAVVERLEMTGLSEGSVITNKSEFSKGLNKANTENKSQAVAKDVFGFTLGEKVFINKDKLNFNTPIHEFGHLWFAWAKDNRRDLLNKGLDLIEDSKYLKQIKEQAKDRNSVYHNMSEEKLKEEALVTAIGNKGEDFINSKAKGKFLTWLSELWKAVSESLGISQMNTDQVQDLSLEDFAQAVAIDLLKGETFTTSKYTIQSLLDEKLSNKKGKLVNVQTINQILKQKGTKKIEKDIINEVLNLEAFKGKDKIPFDLFKAEVNQRIMPLTVIETKTFSDYGIDSTGVEGRTVTNIYNTDLDHQIVGHFTSDYSETKVKPSNMVVRNIPGTDLYAVTRLGVQLTEDNIQDNVFHASTSYEDAEMWIEDYKNSLPITNKGLFGHTRVWTDNEDVYVAEIQSDSFQKAKAEDMLITSYSENPKRMTKEQRKVWDAYNRNKNIIKDAEGNFVDEDTGLFPYEGVKELYDYINELSNHIRTTESEIKASTDEKFKTRFKERVDLLKSQLNTMISFAKGEKVKLGDPSPRAGEYFLPYNKISKRGTTGYKLNAFPSNKENKKWVEGKYVDVGNNFETPQEALDYYKKNILPDIKVNPKKYEEYFYAKRDLGKNYRDLMDKASIQDKQFLAHRKNYTDRLLREEIKSNAEKGKKTLSIPTPRTLAIIEGYLESEGNQPYEVIQSDRNDLGDDLSVGDIIDFLGEEHIVVYTDAYEINAVPKNKGQIIDAEEVMRSMVDSMVDEVMYTFDQELGDRTELIEDEWEDIKKEISSPEIDQLTAEEVSESITVNEDGEPVYTIDRDIIEKNVREWQEEFYSDTESNLNDLYAEVYKLEYDEYFVTQEVVFGEYLKQPDQYEGTSVEDFDIDDMTSSEQTVLRKYEELVEKFKSSRLDASIITDDKGNEWIRTNLTEEDGSKAIASFQVVGENAVVTKSMYDLSSGDFVSLSDQTVEIASNINGEYALLTDGRIIDLDNLDVKYNNEILKYDDIISTGEKTEEYKLKESIVKKVEAFGSNTDSPIFHKGGANSGRGRAKVPVYGVDNIEDLKRIEEYVDNLSPNEKKIMTSAMNHGGVINIRDISNDIYVDITVGDPSDYYHDEYSLVNGDWLKIDRSTGKDSYPKEASVPSMIRRSAAKWGTLSENIIKAEEQKERDKQLKINKRSKKVLTPEQESKLRRKAPHINPILANLFEKKASAYVMAEVFPSDSKWYPLIKELSTFEKSVGPITLDWQTEQENRTSGGLYDRSTDQIKQNRHSRNPEYIITHEFVHGVTVKAVEKVFVSTKVGVDYINDLNKFIDENKKSEDELKRTVANIAELYFEAAEKSGEMDNLKKYANIRGGRGLSDYGFTNLHEFTAEVITDGTFQEKLNNIQTESGIRTLFDKFIDLVSDLMRALGGKGVASGSILEAAISETARLMNQQEEMQTHPKDLDAIARQISVKEGVEKSFESSIEQTTIQQNIENISSIFDSRLELLDLYSSKEEAEINKDINDCG